MRLDTTSIAGHGSAIQKFILIAEEKEVGVKPYQVGSEDK
jgi:hypothetical protein